MTADSMVDAARAQDATARPAGAWGGDPARKRASISAARAALAAGPVVMCGPTLGLGEAGQPNGASNVYCAAYGTADPAELESRAGLPASTLMLASASLCGCEHWAKVGDDDRRRLELVGRAQGAPIAALEAIRAGADPFVLLRNYVVDLLGELATLRDNNGRGLTSQQQALLRQLAMLHDEGCTDPVTFRALRRTATVATDAATSAMATTVLRFVESVTWPLGGLAAEMPEFTMRVHVALRSHLAPDRLSVAEQAVYDALTALYAGANERLMANPKLDANAEFGKIEATPEFVTVNGPAFRDRLEHLALVEAEAYAPFAVDLLIGAFRKA